jgi:hypothetical protein
MNIAGYNILNSIKRKEKLSRYPYSALNSEKLISTKKTIEILVSDDKANAKKSAAHSTVKGGSILTDNNYDTFDMNGLLNGVQGGGEDAREGGCGDAGGVVIIF